jgi:single-stranded DNA-binding protein
MYVNKVILCGELAGDPTVAFISDRGTQQTTFTLLTVKIFNERMFRTYTPCVAYGKQAEKLGELSKGDTVLVDGELSWQAGNKDGKKPGRLEVFCTNVEVMRVPAMAVSEN